MIRAMHCTACGYDLAAHSSDQRCPECGLDVDMTVFIEEERAYESTPERFGTLVIGGVWMFCAGAIALAILVAVSRQPGVRWYAIVIAGAIPSILAGILSSLLWMRYARVWATIFAWPMVLWGAVSTFLVLSTGTGLLIWSAVAVVTLAATIAGALIGQQLVRTRVPRQPPG